MPLIKCLWAMLMHFRETRICTWAWPLKAQLVQGSFCEIWKDLPTLAQTMILWVVVIRVFMKCVGAACAHMHRCILFCVIFRMRRCHYRAYLGWRLLQQKNVLQSSRGHLQDGLIRMYLMPDPIRGHKMTQRLTNQKFARHLNLATMNYFRHGVYSQKLKY